MMKNILPVLSWLLLFAAQAQAQLMYERRYIPDLSSSAIQSSTPDGQGNILFSGLTTTGFSQYTRTLLLAKPDADTLWTRKSPTILPRYYYDLKSVPGGFVFGSWNNSAAYLEHIRADGTTATLTNFTPPPISLTKILVLPGKDFLMVGSGIKNGYAFLRTDSLGNIKWFKTYMKSSGIDRPIDMQFTADGNILVAGASDNPIGPFHPKLLLINQNGDSLLGRQLIITGFNRSETMQWNSHSVTALSASGFLLTADTDTVKAGFPGGAVLGMVVKVDANLNVVWKYVHRTPAIDEVYFTKSRELADGSVLVLGSRVRPTDNSFALYRFNLAGQLTNVYPFTSNICTDAMFATTLDVLNDSTFMIGGRCGNGVNIAMYIATVKVPNLPAVLPVITSVKQEQALAATALGQSYPNPAQDQAIISYHLPNSTRNAKILLTDITGREVGSYSLKTNQKQGSLPVNLSRLSNGLYLYSLVIDGKPVATKKLAVAR